MPRDAATWQPRSGYDEFGGCIWLPRLVSKGRRVLEMRSGNRIGEYMFGESDPSDSELLRFLGLTSQHVLDVVQAEADDNAAAAHLLQISGKTPEQCARFTRKFRRIMGVFLAMMDADEHPDRSGLRKSFLRFVYNRIVVPPAYWFFAWQERRAARVRNA